MANRLLIVEIKTSFLGHEDRTLAKKLLAERAGILLWAIEGWARLQQRGHFVLPSSSAAIMDAVKNLASPVHAFLTSWCVLDPDRKVTTERLYRAFRAWSLQQGTKQIPNATRFGKDLRAAAPAVANKRLCPSTGGGKAPHYVGVGLKPGVFDDLK